MKISFANEHFRERFNRNRSSAALPRHASSLVSLAIATGIIASCGSAPKAAAPARTTSSPTGLSCTSAGSGAGWGATLDDGPRIRSATLVGDTFKLTFDSGTPKFEVTPQSSPHFWLTSGKGGTIDLNGSAGVRIKLSGFQGDRFNYSGPVSMTSSGPLALQAYEAGDYEGDVDWAVGVSRPACAHVTATGSTLVFQLIAQPTATNPTQGAGTIAKTGHHEQLFAAVKSSTTGAFSANPDTIVIAGLDGVIRATSHFQPRAIPFQGARMPPVAQTAAGRAYFIDADGTIYSLGSSGDVRTETRFPVTSHNQEASFAVSPDGRSLIGSVVTLPPNLAGSAQQPSGQFSMDVMTATAGAPATVSYHETWTGSAGGSGAQFLSWGPRGPVAVYPAPLRQTGGGITTYSDGHLVQFRDGKPGSAVPISNTCFMNDVLKDGRYVCTTPQGAFEVHAIDGSPLWQRRHAPGDGYFTCFLSPDAQHVVAYGGPQVIGQDSRIVALASRFNQLGWLDASTVIGHTWDDHTQDELAYLTLKDPTRLVDLGFTGTFVGTLAQ
jgi:hypothetical protein